MKLTCIVDNRVTKYSIDDLEKNNSTIINAIINHLHITDYSIIYSDLSMFYIETSKRVIFIRVWNTIVGDDIEIIYSKILNI